jgi:cell division protein FtsB
MLIVIYHGLCPLLKIKNGELRMMKVIVKLLKTVSLTFIFMYACFVLLEQQMKISELEQQKNDCLRLSQEENMKTEQLNKTKGELQTPEYIEKVAREKLGLVMAYETVFVDASR